MDRQTGRLHRLEIGLEVHSARNYLKFVIIIIIMIIKKKKKKKKALLIKSQILSQPL